MPEPPSTSLITQYVFESPWALAAALVIIAAVMAYTALREGLGKRLALATIPAALAVIVILLGLFVTTAGEEARRVTESFVNEVVANDLRAARALTSDDCVMNSRDPNLPGILFSDVDDRLGRRRGWTIEENAITMLDGYTVSDRVGDVHLACRTTFANGFTLTSWVVRVERDADDTWRIKRITWINFMNDPAPAIDRLY